MTRTNDESSPSETADSGTLEALRHNERRLLEFGTPVYAGTAVAATLLAPASGLGILVGKVAAFLGFFAHGLALRMWIVTPMRDEIDSTSRWVLLRWLTRLAYLAAGIWGYATFITPVVNIFVVTGTFVGLTMVVGWYTRWSYRRDARGAPIHPVEKVVLIGTALFVAVTLCILILSAAAAGFALSWLMEAW